MNRNFNMLVRAKIFYNFLADKTPYKFPGELTVGTFHPALPVKPNKNKTM